jgi:hypothetical protein
LRSHVRQVDFIESFGLACTAAIVGRGCERKVGGSEKVCVGKERLRRMHGRDVLI